MLSVEHDGTPNYVQENAAGSRLPSVPDWKYTVSVDYSIDVDNLPFSFTGYASYVWQDRAYYDIKGSPLSTQGSFGVANLSVGIVEKVNRRYEASIFVHNAFDEFYTGRVGDGFSGTVVTGLMLSHNPIRSHRYVGLKVRFNW